MLTAITRAVSPSIGRCELAYLARRPIDVERAVRQHRAYQQALGDAGARVLSLPALEDFPDAVFVEDPAIVVDRLAVINITGAASRRGEAASLAEALAPFRPLRRLEPPATLEGGDVIRIGFTLYVGLSARTNAEGIRQLRGHLEPVGYAVETIAVRGAMHLKTACCYLGNGAVLANRDWVDAAALRGCRILSTPPEEPWAANVLLADGALILPAAFPATRRMLEREGYDVRAVDVSELMKAEAGVTCMSLVFEAHDTPVPAPV